MTEKMLSEGTIFRVVKGLAMAPSQARTLTYCLFGLKKPRSRTTDFQKFGRQTKNSEKPLAWAIALATVI